MKKIFCFAFLLVALNTFAQQEFAPLGATWNFPEVYFSGGNTGVVTFTSIGDTVIQNKLCKIIYKDNWTCYHNSGNHYFHQTNDSVFYFNEQIDSFILMYAFNAEVGDSWKLQQVSDNYWLESFECIVDSIDYFHYTDSDSLKIQHVTLRLDEFSVLNGDTIYDNYQSFSNQLIENIGFKRALLPIPFMSICDGDFELDLRCYEDSEVGLINFSEVPCLFTSSKEVSNFSHLKIFPNPTSDQISISFENDSPKKTELQLLDFQGITVFQTSKTFAKKETFEIQTQHLPAGIYFLKATHNNTSTIQKIVIQQ